MIGIQFLQCLIFDKIFKRIQLENLEVFLYRIEFQPWEKAIIYNTRNRTKSIGYQHSTLGSNFLNYQFADGELAEHWKNQVDINSMPLPDHILTLAKQGVHYMNRGGYPINNLSIGGAIRYRRLFDFVKNKQKEEKQQYRRDGDASLMQPVNDIQEANDQTEYSRPVRKHFFPVIQRSSPPKSMSNYFTDMSPRHP